jgi:hypothetical protein
MLARQACYHLSHMFCFLSVPLDNAVVCICFECVLKGSGVGNLGHNVEVLKEGGVF